AGVGVGGAFIDTKLDAELNMIALNCMHTIHLAKLVVPAMASRGQGRVLITGSVVSTAPSPFKAVYGATKAFVMSFGEALRYELKDTGVTVTVLQPNATDTNFFPRADLMDTKVGQAKKDDPAVVAKQGFDAMMAGKDAVLGGSFKSRMQGFMNELLPETTKAKVMGDASKPGSAKQ
ncbi:MAG TPA: SDR family NAD(P)-dependent oxidoreductase, partial [Kofleriaceae bacterium]